MKQIVSSLNPYAASYVPLSKRESHDATADPFQSPPYHAAQNQHHQFHSSALASKPVVETFQGNINNPASSSYGSVPAGFVDNQFADYDPDMDVEYLRMQFPGISEESLRDVYMVNECDIDAAVEMLNQLELKVMLFGFKFCSPPMAKLFGLLIDCFIVLEILYSQFT